MSDQVEGQAAPQVKASMPWWASIGWVLVGLTTLSGIATMASASNTGGDETQFLNPFGWVVLLVGLLLGVAGLVVKELRKR